MTMRKTKTSWVRASAPARQPNKETKRALREARARKDLERFASARQWAKSVRAL
jgi:hypothetical protein